MSAILAWITGSTLGRKVAQWAALAALALAAVWKIYDAGKDAERGRQAEDDLEALRERNTINDDVAKTPDADLRDELFGGCATSGSGCDGFAPIRPTADDVPVISNSLTGHIVAHNRFGASSCGLNP